MTAKQHILARLQSARGGSRLPRLDVPALPAEVRLSAEACRVRFEVEATALGVECYVESSEAGVHTRLADLVGERRVVSWDAAHLPYAAGGVLRDPIQGTATTAEQASAEVGVTGCAAAVAETGSLVLFSGAGRSRTISLLPPFHVALVEPARILLSMANVFERYRAEFLGSASCTFITGPSRTADIELTLTLGIHGPGRVAVIIGP